MSQGSVSFEVANGVPHPQQESDDHDDNTPEDYFSVDSGGSDIHASGRSAAGGRRASMTIRIPPNQIKTDMAFTALQYLPMPILVLGSDKRVVLANEAMGRLFGIDPDAIPAEEENGEDGPSLTPSTTPHSLSATDILYGTTLAQLGVDLLQGGSAVFVAWEEFLETVVDDAARSQSSTTQLNIHHPRNLDHDATPTDSGRHKRSHSQASSARLSHSSGTRTEVHDAVVTVVFSTSRSPQTGLPLTTRATMTSHVEAQMIISVWATEDEQFFTMTFTAAHTDTPTPPAEAVKTTSRTVTRTQTSHHLGSGSGLSSTSSSGSSGQRRHHNYAGTPTSTSGVTSPSSHPLMTFPPRGPPSKSSAVSAPTIFSKTNRLKDAILNSMSIPAYAMWKDETFGIPNNAAIKLIYPWIEDGAFDSSEQATDFLSRYKLYRDDFSEEIPLEEFPIMRLMREQKPFENFRVGMYSAKDGSRLLFDTSGETLTDAKGEFLGGLVLFHDVTGYARTINRQIRKNEEQFQDICNMIPQMIWRTTPDGSHDYYSDRWYSYTGLTEEESHGLGWLNAFHPDDLEIAKPRWAHSLATGDEYRTEYRCKNAAGEWRWMLGSALPMRDDNGQIVKWFGTCTDIHAQVEAREEARQTRAALEKVIEHANITLWAINRDYTVSLFEGKSMSDPTADARAVKGKVLGQNIWDLFQNQSRSSEIPAYKMPAEAVMSGVRESYTIEEQVQPKGRWFRTRLYPLLRQERKGDLEGPSFIDGVVGVSMDVTDAKLAETAIKERDRENGRLMAQSVAAKEASKMKSQFLANMSHEIRTPIAGVIGMSELLLDDDTGDLSKDQRECAENIQRSANGLLTVINDILDFSKVESGRLDIEEVQFDLSVVIRDVNKMLSFAAERKGLEYIADIQQMKSWKVMGDPGRLRQVMTNLLTNSIKFTSEGSVTMRVNVSKETAETLEVHFTVEDTGIGIEEEVRQKLFKPFSQADSSTARRFGGTGLGLTISKNLVELMHGEIHLESKLDVGTKATFWIPFHKAPYQTSDSPLVDIGSIPDRLQSEMSVSRAGSDNSGPPTPVIQIKGGHQRESSMATHPGVTTPPTSEPSAQPQELTPAERKDVNVLVVEDNPVNQQIALKTIRKLGFPVQAVWNGQEALEYLQKTPTKENPRPDIILMDVQMPIMDGYRATYTIRNTAPFTSIPELTNLPIVAMTASAIQGDREKCQMSGMDDYLAKPVKKPNLEKMLVKWAIEGRRKRLELAKTPSGQAPRAARPIHARVASSFVSEEPHQSSQEHLASELDRLEFAHRAAAERSAESAGDAVIREQAAEEKAIVLRDDVLLESGEDPKTRLGRGVSNEGDDDVGQDADHALTTENVHKYFGIESESAKSTSDRLGALRRERHVIDDANSSLAVTLGDDSADNGPGSAGAVTSGSGPGSGGGPGVSWTAPVVGDGLRRTPLGVSSSSPSKSHTR